MSEWRETNRAWCDERVPIDVRSRLYAVVGLLAGASALYDVVVDEVRDAAGGAIPSLPLMSSLLATAPA